MKRLALLILWAAPLLAVGPKYDRPSTEYVPAEWATTAERTSDAEVAADAAWWDSFGDPLLSELIRTALEQNYTLAETQARLAESRAGVKDAWSAHLPDIGFGGSYNRARVSENGVNIGSAAAQQGLISPTIEFYQLGFDASWEADVFGGTRKRVKGSAARRNAADWAYRGARLSAAAEVARAYFALRGAQERHAVASERIRVQEQTLELVQARRDAGLAAELEVSQARGQLESTRASLPQFIAAIRTSANRVAVLTGQAPAEAAHRLTAQGALPEDSAAIPTGLPADLIARRPDLREAEWRLIAANSGIGRAKSDLYPKFTLTGNAALESGRVGNLLEAASRTWIFTPGFRLPIFNWQRIRANIRAAKARDAQALAAFHRSVLVALEDVENGLTVYGTAQQRAASLGEASQATGKAVELSRVLYEEGLSDFLGVLDAEQRYFQTRDAEVVARRDVLTGKVALYKALGGGWAAQ